MIPISYMHKFHSSTIPHNITNSLLFVSYTIRRAPFFCPILQLFFLYTSSFLYSLIESLNVPNSHKLIKLEGVEFPASLILSQLGLQKGV